MYTIKQTLTAVIINLMTGAKHSRLLVTNIMYCNKYFVGGQCVRGFTLICRDLASAVMLVNVRSASLSVRKGRELKRGSRVAAV